MLYKFKNDNNISVFLLSSSQCKLHIFECLILKSVSADTLFYKNGTHCTTILVNRIEICGTQDGTQTPFLNN